MSHKATNWLSGIAADALGHSEFRVLFHLCDCHNPSRGCFPTQEYLKLNSNVSNGTLNNALNALEEKGLIQRHRLWDDTTKRQKPTRYRLGFEIENGAEPTPKIGDGAVSNSEGDPSPTERATRLQPTGEKPVKKPVKNPAREASSQKKDDEMRKVAVMWAEKIRAGAYIPANGISKAMRQMILDLGLLSEADLAKAGIS